MPLKGNWNLRDLLAVPALVARVYIGGLFIYASLSKINYSAEFAEIIASYQMVPDWAVNFTAVTLPWAELICGILLIIGLRSKSAAVIIAGMLSVFSLAIAINLVRGTPIGCGCFSSLEAPMTWMTFLRDLFWLGLTIYIFRFDRLFHLERQFLPSIRIA
ncbi:MAG: MauE/DoxX family redox-associated membrane protein [Desulfobacterales bacterium]